MISCARVPGRCPFCSSSADLEVGEELLDGRLRWFERQSCGCGHGFEDRGEGVAALVVRRALLAQTGRAEVWVDEPKAVPSVLAVLKAGFGLNEAEAKQKLARLPAVAFEGTHVEAAYVRALLESGGVTARVVNHLP